VYRKWNGVECLFFIFSHFFKTPSVPSHKYYDRKNRNTHTYIHTKTSTQTTNCCTPPTPTPSPYTLHFNPLTQKKERKGKTQFYGKKSGLIHMFLVFFSLFLFLFLCVCMHPCLYVNAYMWLVDHVSGSVLFICANRKIPKIKVRPCECVSFSFYSLSFLLIVFFLAHDSETEDDRAGPNQSSVRLDQSS
jgi:hypothetical protein